MKRAEWAGAVLAESDDIVMVEGNAYFTHWHEKCILSSASAMTGRGGL
jgi:hypothetical protein